MFIVCSSMGKKTVYGFCFLYMICKRIPIVGGNSLDLHRLFVEVTSRGGIEKVTSNFMVPLSKKFLKLCFV